MAEAGEQEIVPKTKDFMVAVILRERGSHGRAFIYGPNTKRGRGRQEGYKVHSSQDDEEIFDIDAVAGIAQLGEQQTEDLEVPCSIHGPGISFSTPTTWLMDSVLSIILLCFIHLPTLRGDK